MSHHHFTPIECGKIEKLNKLGFSCRAIAKRLNRHHSSIARELQRVEEYSDHAAQHNYEEKRLNSNPKGKWTKEL